jgi:hypothetical protein
MSSTVIHLFILRVLKPTDHGEARGIDGGEKLKDVNVKL